MYVQRSRRKKERTKELNFLTDYEFAFASLSLFGIPSGKKCVGNKAIHLIINERLLCGIITLRLLRKPFKEMKTY